jgi:hypothetical protein
MVFVKYIFNHKGITFYANRHFLVFTAIFAGSRLTATWFWQVFGVSLAELDLSKNIKQRILQTRMFASK